MSVLEGDAGTPTDDADVRLGVNFSDVRRKSNLADYVGQLEARITLRLTDRLNGAEQDSATRGDVLRSSTWCPAPARATPPSDRICSTSTTADAVTPGVVPEGSRAVWQLGQVVACRRWVGRSRRDRAERGVRGAGRFRALMWRILRLILWAFAYVLATVVTAVVVLYSWAFFVMLVVGDSECDRGECSAVGEFTDGNWRLLSVLALSIAALLVAILLRRFRRPMRP